MLRVSILGSCVTSDAFEEPVESLKEVSYHSRTSFVSLNSPPLAIAGEELTWASNYARKRVLADFNKTILPEICACRPDIIAFDLIDERFDLLRSAGSYVTHSNVLVDSGFPGSLPYVFERIPRDSREATDLWKQAAVAVTSKIRESMPAVRFVLHRAWWAEEYVDGPRTIRFSANERREAARMNKLLSKYYSHLEKYVPGVRPVEVRRPHRASAQHRWGLAPFHYEPRYYTELLSQIVQRASALDPQPTPSRLFARDIS